VYAYDLQVHNPKKNCESLHNKYFLSLALSMYETIGLREQGRILGETKF
jgi:hypothetical protein